MAFLKKASEVVRETFCCVIGFSVPQDAVRLATSSLQKGTESFLGGNNLFERERIQDWLAQSDNKHPLNKEKVEEIVSVQHEKKAFDAQEKEKTVVELGRMRDQICQQTEKSGLDKLSCIEELINELVEGRVTLQGEVLKKDAQRGSEGACENSHAAKEDAQGGENNAVMDIVTDDEDDWGDHYRGSRQGYSYYSGQPRTYAQLQCFPTPSTFPATNTISDESTMPFQGVQTPEQAMILSPSPAMMPSGNQAMMAPMMPCHGHPVVMSSGNAMSWQGMMPSSGVGPSSGSPNISLGMMMMLPANMAQQYVAQPNQSMHQSDHASAACSVYGFTRHVADNSKLASSGIARMQEVDH
jgi:hypothetical protein